MSDFYTEGAAWITQWQADERARWANSNVDGAANSAGRAAYRYTGEASLWGKPIPITWGTRRITGQLLQVGLEAQKTTVVETLTFPELFNDQVGNSVGSVVFTPGQVANNITFTPETKFTSTFAYCFGAPGNPDAVQILRKLWFNGQLVYDINQGYLSSEIRFKFYQGDETQMPDAELNKERYTHPVAYRGLMYITFYEYTVKATTGGGNPVVEAEFAEQVTNTQPAWEFDNFGEPQVDGVEFYPSGISYDAKKNVVYVVGADNNIYKYKATDRELIDVYPCEVPDMESRVFTWLRVANVFYFAGINSGSNSPALYLINADTGKLVSTCGVDSSSLTPDAETYPGINYATAVTIKEAQGEVGYLTVSDVFHRAIYKFTIAEGAMTYTSRYDIASDDGGWGVTVTQKGKLHTYHADGINLMRDNASFFTGEHPISMLFPCNVDSSLIVFERPTSGPEYNIYKLYSDGTVGWKIDETNSPALDPPATTNSVIAQSNTANQRFGWRTSSQLVVIDFLSGTFDLVPLLPGWPSSQQFVYDAYSNSFILAGGLDGYVQQRPILVQTTDNMLLSTLLRNLAERQGYETANIEITGINDQIIGAVIGEVSNLDNIFTDLRKAYNFEIIKRGPKIRFTRRGYGSDFEVDATLKEEDRALLSDSEDEFITVESEISPPGQTPGTIRLKYIDPDYNYTANEFIHKRNIPGTDTSSEMQLELPIIMVGSDAAALAARVILNAAMNGVTHDFRLPQKYLAYEPGDVFSLEFDDYTDTVRAVEIAYNADWSMSVKSEAILTDVGPTYALEPPILPPENPSLISGEAEPVFFDTSLLRPEDQQLIPTLEMYVGAIGSGRLPVSGATTIKKTVNGSNFAFVGRSDDELTYGRALDKLEGPVLSIEYERSLRFRLVQGDATDFQTADKYDVLAGTANRLLVGRQGRWEQVGFIEASFDAATQVVTVTGLIRGLRGTEQLADLREVGDMVVLIQEGTIIQSYDDPELLNQTAAYAVADGVGRLNLADAVATPILGWTRRPWAVANVHVVNNAGDLDLSWHRRTRLYGPLNNGNPDVPLDEAAELYDIQILRAGVVVRTVENLTSPAYTYTAAQQAADGWSGPIVSLPVYIYQVSDLVGRGFVKAGTYDVE